MDGILKLKTPKTHPIFKFQGAGADYQLIEDLLIIRRLYLKGLFVEELDYFFDKLKLEYLNKKVGV